MTSSPGSAYRPPSVADVDLSGFWGERADAVASRTVRILYDRCVAAGMLDQLDPDRPVPELRYPWHRRSDGAPPRSTCRCSGTRTLPR